MPTIKRIDPGQEKEVTHKKCGAVIGYFTREVKKGTYTDYGGGSEVWYYIICPHCDEKVEVNQPKF